MKLLRHGPVGAEKAGALDKQGRMRDLSLLVPDWTPEWLSPEKLDAIAAIDLERMPFVPENSRIGTPVAGVRQFVAIGLNYRKHALESGMEIPDEPVVFAKAITSLAGPNDNVVLPEGAETADWEIELGVVIGTTARQVSVDDALKHVAGYCLANDVSERDWQIHRNGLGIEIEGCARCGGKLKIIASIEEPQVIAKILSHLEKTAPEHY
ncbi:MAG: 2-hydroxyhepta-2,4-diene-1,7-dioate isomerase, partial [Proteobacteria bacterium]